jgi:hypothetical protein
VGDRLEADPPRNLLRGGVLLDGRLGAGGRLRDPRGACVRSGGARRRGARRVRRARAPRVEEGAPRGALLPAPFAEARGSHPGLRGALPRNRPATGSGCVLFLSLRPCAG